MNEYTRQVTESPLYQGMDEQIAYTLTTTNWGSTPSTPSAKLYEKVGNSFTEVTSTCLSGSASATGDVVTTPVVKLLTPGAHYRLEIQFTISGNVFEAWCEIRGER